MQHFASQLVPAQQSTRSQRVRPRRHAKRKRNDGDDDDDDHNDDDHADHEADGSSARKGPMALALADPPEIASHPRGRPSDDDAESPSPKPFPRMPIKSASPNRFARRHIPQRLAQLDPPLLAPSAASQGRPDGEAVRHAHLRVLTSVLHRCLLEGDFPRAGRAWGLILRTQIAGTPIDPRNHARWGIGAELLLHQRTPQLEEEPQRVRLYTEEGFQLARDYYEHLIVQHSNRKWMPHAIDELTFYPAMFSLWIFETCENSRRRRAEREEASQTSDEDTTMTSDDGRVHSAAIVAEEMQQAKQIATRMDQLIQSPPFDKHGDLLQLRGMVGLWLADLILGKSSGEGGDEPDNASEYDDSGMDASLPERLQRYIESRRELTRAQDIFRRAHANGRQLSAIMDRVRANIDDLSQKIANLTHVDGR